ncbi:Disease resistance protein RUN1 [Linum perenne]
MLPTMINSSIAGYAPSSSSSSSNIPFINFPNLIVGEASSSTPSSTPARHLIYEVFLSFRGSDTRHGFVSHLYNALKKKGISTFKDDQKLERGKFISPEILRVIRHSRLAIVVFSKDYASSPWCLEELQTIIQCMEEEDEEKKSIHAVLPVFYGVDPSDVSDVKNSYAGSFARHEEDSSLDVKLVQSWKATIIKAATLSGWDSHTSREEPTLIDEIVGDVLNKLGRRCLSKPLGYVGMEPRIKQIESMLNVGLVDVRIVGIWGMSGIGKTTTAEAVYYHISHKFDAVCFLKNVSHSAEKHGLDYLRNKLLSALIAEDCFKILDEQLDVLMHERLRSKCVLVVLDDVSNINQLKSLAGDREWFGPGSRITITTKDKHLLEQLEVDSVYDVKPLSNDESLQLFRQHAFKKRLGSPMHDFVALSQRVVNYAQGLLLALGVLGSCLFNMDIGAWESKLKELEEVPHQDIVKILKLSFDVLDRSMKNVFLDVACFFKGEDKDYIVSILEGCGFVGGYGLEVLLRRSLVSIQDNKVWMHELLQQMGWEVVKQESYNDAGRRSRLWNHQDVCNVLAQKTGTKVVEGVVLDLSNMNQMSLEVEAFQEMNRLRLLKICYLHQSGSSEYIFQKGLRNLSNELRSLHWHGYPFDYLPTNFYPKNLVEFNMSGSRLKKLWKGFQNKLKFMKLNGSQQLTHTPDVSDIQNLEIMILEGCVKLIEVHPSVGLLEKLVYLNMKGCRSLRYLPPGIAIRSLEILDLSGCSKLKKFPETVGNMERLSGLLLDGTNIAEIPASIQKLTGLLVLSVTGCKRLEFLPEGVGHCHALKILRLSGCPNLCRVEFELKSLVNLEELHAEGTALKLTSLLVNGDLNKLTVFKFRGSNRNPASSSTRSRLDACELNPLSEPWNFVFPEYPSLTTLDLSNCNLYVMYDISCMVHLKKLDLSGNDFSFLPDEDLPENLEVLILANCRNFQGTIYMRPKMYCLEAPNCTSLSYMQSPEAIGSASLRGINFMNCINLESIMVREMVGNARNIKGKVAVELLKIHAEKTPSHLVAGLSIITADNSIIQEWLPSKIHLRRTQAEVMLPQDIHYTLKGLALWAIFSVRGSISSDNLSLEYSIKSEGKTVISEVGFSLSSGTMVKSEHTWMRFIPALLFKSFSKSGGYVKAVIETNSPVLMVKSCGLYPIRWEYS